MLPLNVPFLPDPDYVGFLEDLGTQLHAVHFSLHEPALSDARIRFEEINDETLIRLLTKLPKVRKYLLANGRFQQMQTYSGKAGSKLVGRLENLLGAGVIDGVIFADSYLLRFLGDTASHVTSRLEAIPSINFTIDDAAKLIPLMELISSCGFQSPGKIPMDRSLNRQPGRLEILSQDLRNRWPEIKLELLANEGCMAHCPFRATHEALIAAANTAADGQANIDTSRLNRDLACQRHFQEKPQRILASPFIRPEDVHHYEKHVDLLKICGRTLGAEFLRRTVEAYAVGRHPGNLLELLDASHWMADQYHIDNDSLPSHFLEMLSSCRGDCSGCNTCTELFRSLARRKPLQLRDWRGVSSS